MRQTLTVPKMITLILFLQIVPLILFPPASFSPATQEWWLPVVLAVLALAGVLELVIRKSHQSWPWYLIGFAQGFNIISRLMMLMPHATYMDSGTQFFNSGYVLLSVISMILSGFMLWYIEWPEVRLGLARE